MMEEDEDEEVYTTMTSFFTRLLGRSFVIYDEQTEIEQQMVDQALNESMDTHHQSLFRRDSKICLEIEPSEWNQDPEKCFICLEMMERGEMVVRIPCSHVFHGACIQDFITHQHRQCPLCRTAIPTHRPATPEMISVASDPARNKDEGDS